LTEIKPNRAPIKTCRVADNDLEVQAATSSPTSGADVAFLMFDVDQKVTSKGVQAAWKLPRKRCVAVSGDAGSADKKKLKQ